MDNPEKKHKLWSTAVKLFVSGSLIACFLLIVLRNFLTKLLLHNQQGYSSVFIIVALGLVFYVASTFLISIINGQHEIKLYTYLNIIGSLIGLAVSYLLVIKYSIFGALCSLIISQSMLFFVIAFVINKYTWFSWQYMFHKFDYKSFKLLMRYTAMSIISASVIPLSQIAIRNLLISKLSLDIAGNWQGLQRISDAYLLIAYTAFGTYFLPKFASLKGKKDLLKELVSTYYIIIPFMLLATSVIYMLREYIVIILYSDKFSIMPKMFFWQLCGDFFKIVAWPLGLIFMSKGRTWVIAINDFIFNILVVGLTYLTINVFNYQAPMVSFMLTYLCWWLWLILLFYKMGIS